MRKSLEKKRKICRFYKRTMCVRLIAVESVVMWNEEEKHIELDGTRDELGCEMRCEAGSNIDEREIENL
jgi:hypothetical protein